VVPAGAVVAGIRRRPRPIPVSCLAMDVPALEGVSRAPRRPDAPIVVVGAGPAGLTAAYALVRAGERPIVLEADSVVGGIARTVERDGWRFDIGGHRFFTKVPRVEALWYEILPDGDFLLRPRMSRIYYAGRFFDYPLRPLNALRNLGPLEAARCMGSYLWVRLRPPKDQSSFEGWTAARFGWRLYRTFFKTYTEKVWGVPASEIRADWAAQRIKNLSLGKAVARALMPRRNRKDVTSLIEEFHYPRLGPGMMWERCAELVRAGGGTVELEAPVVAVRRDKVQATAVVVERRGCRKELACSHVISSMPLKALVEAMEPPAPQAVRQAASHLRYRDFLTVALVVPQARGFPDNWIYVHYPGVKVGRIQNFGSWSPWMVREGTTCLGLEYFVFEGDELWQASDEELVRLATEELVALGLVTSADVERGYVVRMPKAYPVYDEGYAEAVATIRSWLETAVPNVHPVGRNGMHKYNNQDHSMLTALLAVENILEDAGHDIWAVNVEEDYLEERRDEAPMRATGRDAPVLPRRPTARAAG
jgi:protoporphyrinogen oxidase